MQTAISENFITSCMGNTILCRIGTSNLHLDYIKLIGQYYQKLSRNRYTNWRQVIFVEWFYVTCSLKKVIWIFNLFETLYVDTSTFTAFNNLVNLIQLIFYVDTCIVILAHACLCAGRYFSWRSLQFLIVSMNRIHTQLLHSCISCVEKKV